MSLQYILKRSLLLLGVLIGIGSSNAFCASDDLDWFLPPVDVKKVFEIRLSENDKAGKSIDIATDIKIDQFGDKLIKIISKRTLRSGTWKDYFSYKLDDSRVMLVEESKESEFGREGPYSRDIIIMRFPLSVGSEWKYSVRKTNPITLMSTDEFHKRKVVGNEKIKTPAGEFDCIVLSDEVDGVGMVQYDYYAKGVGLVGEKVVFNDEVFGKSKSWMRKLVKVSK